MSKGLRERKLSSWKELRDALEELESAGFAFRGQANARWRIESSLTRYLNSFCPRNGWLSRENKILHLFKRRAHLLLSRTPAEDETVEWLALMQHHGAPTRLLDFTWSPYVAAFFALEKATDDVDAAIWAISSGPKIPNFRGFYISAILNNVLGVTNSKGIEFRTKVKKDIAPLLMGEPVLVNQRMTTQAGTFVIPTKRIDLPIEALAPSSSIFKLILQTKRLRKETMDRLHNMNISNATLFPGIDGLARSLAYELEFDWSVDPHGAERVMGNTSARRSSSRFVKPVPARPA